MSSNETWAHFLAWENASRDTIDVKRIYIDMTGDLAAGVLLSQILYWHLPTAQGHETRMEAQGCSAVHDDKLWLVKKREEWWEECRITPKQFDRLCDLLVKKGYLEVKRFHFRGLPVNHFHLHEERVLQDMQRILYTGSSNFPKWELGTSPNGKLELPQMGSCSKDNTREETFRKTGEETEEVCSDEHTNARAPAKGHLAIYSTGFECFWHAYPSTRKRGKAEAWNIWRRDKLEARAPEIVAKLDALRRYDPAFQEGYEPEPHRWLARKRYDDDLVTQPLTPLGARISAKGLGNGAITRRLIEEIEDAHDDTTGQPEVFRHARDDGRNIF